MTGAVDDVVLDYALANARVLVTHDRTTMLSQIAARRQAGTAVPGVVIARTEQVSIGSLIEALLFLVDAATPDDWKELQFIP